MIFCKSGGCSAKLGPKVLSKVLSKLPKFEDEKVGMNLAIIGSVNDEILISEEIALALIKRLQTYYKGILENRYEIETSDTDTKISNLDVLNAIARKRLCLKKGGELDLVKASNLLLDEYRSGKLGYITLEYPNK